MPGRVVFLISEEDRLRLRAEQLLASHWTAHHHPHVWSPLTNVYESEQAFTVLVEVAGMQDREFAVSLHDNRLVISGVRPNPAPPGICNQLEVHYGEFHTEVLLNGAIDADNVSARYADGFLTVHLPKVSARRIPVNSGTAPER